jgi:hypothetical protein
MPTSVEWSEIVRNHSIVVGGTIGLGIAFWRGLAAARQAKVSREQVELQRRDHVTELFNSAVGQLGRERLEIRLGAIYTLERISREFAEFAFPVFEVLQAYLRERSPALPDEKVTADIVQIVRIIEENARRA